MFSRPSSQLSSPSRSSLTLRLHGQSITNLAGKCTSSWELIGKSRRCLPSYQIYQCLVKFDVFFWVGFSVQFTWLVLDSHSWEFYITCAALPLSIVLLVEGHLAARYENKWMMASFLSGCVGAMIYFSYKFIKVIVKKKYDRVCSCLAVTFDIRRHRHPPAHYDFYLCMDGLAKLWTWPERADRKEAGGCRCKARRVPFVICAP